MPIVFTSTLNLAEEKSTKGQTRIDTHPREMNAKHVYGITQSSQVCLDHQVFEQEDSLVFYWDAVERLFAPGTLEHMFDAYCRLLQRLSANEDTWHAPVGDLLPSKKSTNASGRTIPQNLWWGGCS